MTTPEGRTKHLLKKFLDAQGVYYFMPVQTGYGRSSVDFLCCDKGIFFAIETKRPGVNKPTTRQSLVMQEMRKAGATTYVVTLDERENLIWWKQCG